DGDKAAGRRDSCKFRRGNVYRLRKGARCAEQDLERREPGDIFLSAAKLPQPPQTLDRLWEERPRQRCRGRRGQGCALRRREEPPAGGGNQRGRSFRSGALVSVRDRSGREIGRGLCNFSSEELALIK